MNMLVHAIQKVADLDLSNMTFGKVVLLGAIMAYMVVLFKASKHAGKEAMQAGIGIAAMVIAMDLMVGLVKKLQKLDGNGIFTAPPATILIAIASPNALPIPSTTPVIMPDLAAGRITLNIV